MFSGMSISLVGADKLIRTVTKIIEQTPNVFQVAIKSTCIIVEGRAKELIRSGGYYHPPFDTGVLRQSVTHEIMPLGNDNFASGRVGTGATVFYGIYVHEGTVYMEARPFMDDALEDKQAEIQQIFNITTAKLFTIFG